MLRTPLAKAAAVIALAHAAPDGRTDTTVVLPGDMIWG